MAHRAQKLLTLLFLPLLCLCGKAGKVVLQPIVRIDPPPIVDGETNLYEIVDQNNTPVAIRKVTTTRVIYGEIPVFQVTSLEQITKDTHPIESIVVFISREDMTPIASFHFSRAPKPLFSAAAGYQEGYAEIVTATREGEFKRQIPIGPNTFDIHQLTTLGRALRFGQLKPYYILIVIPATSPPGGMSIAAKISQSGIDTLTTPAGRFECYKLVIESDSGKISLWYERVGARRLIQLSDSSKGETARLISSLIPLTPLKTGATPLIESHNISNETK